MSGRWWRAYGRARHDPKLLKLSDRQFRWWFNLVCVASDNDGILPCHADLAVEFRVSGATMTKALDELIAAGLFDHDETGIRPHNWNGLQYKSDVSNERVKRFRERHRNGECNVTETPSENREQKQIQTGSTEPERTQEASHHERPIKLPSDWQPSTDCRDHAVDKGLDPQSVTEAFTDYFAGGKGRNEKRTPAGWEKRWRVWCNTDAERRSPSRSGSRLQAPRDGGDVGAFARAAARLGGSEPI